MLQIPRYIAESGVVGSPFVSTTITEEMLRKPNAKFEKMIGGHTFRSDFSFSLAAGEWALWRGHLPEKYPAPYYFIEALWASLLDATYLREEYTNWIERAQPITGAGYNGMNRIAIHLGALFRDISRGPNSHILKKPYTLARLLLQDEHKKVFDKWANSALQRQNELYRMPSEYYNFVDDDYPYGFRRKNPVFGGMPIPREAFDPAFDFKLEMTDELISKFLASLNPDQNWFLSKPEDMLVAGFPGTPYKWDPNKVRWARLITK